MKQVFEKEAFWQVIVTVILFLIAFNAYYLAVPVRQDLKGVGKDIASVTLDLAKYQATTGKMFDYVMKTLNKMEFNPYARTGVDVVKEFSASMGNIKKGVINEDR